MRLSLNPLIVVAAMLVLALELGGCVSLLPKSKPAQLYRFGDDAGAPPAPAPFNPAAPRKVGLVLASLGFPRAATSDGILTVTGDRTAYISGARWVAPARILFQEAVQREFQSRTTQVELVNVGDTGPAATVLRLDVSTFEVDYQPSGQVVSVALDARLTRIDGRVLDQRDFSIVKPVPTNSVTAIVHAFDEATDSLLGEVGGWTDDHVSKMLASDPPPPPVSTSSTVSTTTTATSHP